MCVVEKDDNQAASSKSTTADPGIKYIIAVDVGMAEDLHTRHFGDVVNGWSSLLARPFRKWLGWRPAPSLGEIQSRLAFAMNTKRKMELLIHARYYPPGSYHAECFNDSNALMELAQDRMKGAHASNKTILIIKPQVNDVGLLDFGRAVEVEERGYQVAKEAIAKWQTQGLLPPTPKP